MLYTGSLVDQITSRMALTIGKVCEIWNVQISTQQPYGQQLVMCKTDILLQFSFKYFCSDSIPSSFGLVSKSRILILFISLVIWLFLVFYQVTYCLSTLELVQVHVPGRVSYKFTLVNHKYKSCTILYYKHTVYQGPQ